MEDIAAALNYLYAIAAIVLNQDTWKQESGLLSWCAKHPCPTLEHLGLMPGPTPHSSFLPHSGGGIDGSLDREPSFWLRRGTALALQAFREWTSRQGLSVSISLKRNTWKQNQGVSVALQQIKVLPVTPASHVDTGLNPSCSTSSAAVC